MARSFGSLTHHAGQPDWARGVPSFSPISGSFASIGWYTFPLSHSPLSIIPIEEQNYCTGLLTQKPVQQASIYNWDKLMVVLLEEVIVMVMVIVSNLISKIYDGRWMVVGRLIMAEDG